MHTKWIRTRNENRILRADLLVGFDFKSYQIDLLKAPPQKSLGGPASRRLQVFGIFKTAAEGQEHLLLADGYRSYDVADEAIATFLAGLNGVYQDREAVIIHELSNGK